VKQDNQYQQVKLPPRLLFHSEISLHWGKAGRCRRVHPPKNHPKKQALVREHAED
jgi:hypothetical protein